MSRLIDRDALIATLNREKIKYNADVNYFIMDAPTIDAVEVVRCKECRNYCHLVGSCKYFDFMPVKEDDFCSHGY